MNFSHDIGVNKKLVHLSHADRQENTFGIYTSTGHFTDFATCVQIHTLLSLSSQIKTSQKLY